MTAPNMVLCLRLEGPLQAWGDNAHWSIRATRLEPTKSGVIGLIAASMGCRLDDEGDRQVQRLASSLRVGVREERVGAMLRDYHTIGGTRAGKRTPWTGVLQANGKLKVNASTHEIHTEVSERLYLADACFLVGLEGEQTLLEHIAVALQSPQWPHFLGRKSCVPAAPVYPACPDHPCLLPGPLEEALAGFPWLGERNGETPPQHMRMVCEISSSGTGEGLRSQRQDQPVSFARQQFRQRAVLETSVPCPQGGASCT
ncbi:MAG: type I-E CRISPR-associated protein Cas5/CasD [Armatimonadota bacterium]